LLFSIVLGDLKVEFSRNLQMLKLTKKADYALMAMKHLADHAHEGTRSASAKDVADSFGIPPEALAKILQRLAKAGLLQSQHGTTGWRALHTRFPPLTLFRRSTARCSLHPVSRFAESAVRATAATSASRCAK
jgi:hypothetical protein